MVRLIFSCPQVIDFRPGVKLNFAACYENHTKLFVSSEVPIHQVFSDEKGKNAADDANMRASELLYSFPRAVYMLIIGSHG